MKMRALRESVITAAVLVAAFTWTSAASANPKIGLNMPLAGGVQGPQNETAVAVNPKNPQQLVAAAVTYFEDETKGCRSPADKDEIDSSTIALYGSKDGGVSWEYHCAPWPAKVAGGLVSADQWYGDDPSVAWDAEGNAYAAYMLVSWAYGSTLKLSSAIVVARSSDAGSTWAPWSVVVNDITTLHPFHEKPKIAIDTSTEGSSSHPGRVYVTWSQDHVQQVAWSDDGTAWKQTSFSSPAPDHMGGNVAAGPDGVVYLVWNKIHPVNEKGQASAPDSLWFSKSVDGGTQWSPAVKIFAHDRGSLEEYYLPMAQDYWWVNTYASIDVDRNVDSPYFNRVYLAWTDVTSPCCPKSPYGPLDVYTSYSADGGDSWSSPLEVSNEVDDAAFFPWIAVDQSDGTVHTAWYDTRIDPASGEETQVYTARSSDGGVSFEKNLLLTDGGSQFEKPASSSNLNSRTNLDAVTTQYGDYLGIAAANRRMAAVWTDGRQSFEDTLSLREDAAVGSATYCTAPQFEVGPVPGVLARASGSIKVTLPQVLGWGINAAAGTTYLLRYAGANCTGTPVENQVPGGASPATDIPPVAGTYSYKVRVRNNCPGTKLTPMSSLSACSAPVSFVP
jgi:hypothetical protein